MSRVERASLALALTAMLAACGPAPTPPPAAPPPDPLATFLRATYGPDASPRGAWPETIAEEAFTSGVCLDETHGTQRWIAVCSQAADDSHATEGRVALYVVAAYGARVAGIRDLATGSHGNAGSVALLPLGAKRNAFVVEGGGVFQGVAVARQSLWVPRDGTLVEVAELNATYDNSGACGDDCDDAVALDFTVTAAPAAGDAWPDLQVREGGRECGNDVDRTHRLAYDAATGRYAVPPALLRDGCLQSPADTDTETPE